MLIPTLRINKRYIVHELLGQGGMGVVYRATDRLNGQVVALKQVTTLHKQVTDTPSTDNDFQLALSDEFRVLSSLRHPNIISVLDYGFEDKQPYFTMELLESPSTILDAGRSLSLDQRVELLVELLQALVYLHRRGVLHRDLKPGNILVDKNGSVKVLDFGLSLASSYSRSNVQQNTAGTLAYMAPELFADTPASIASDLYAVGVIACELVGGHHPFGQKNIALLINSILSALPDLSNIHYDLTIIIARLLAKQPEERYANAAEVIRILCDTLGRPAPIESVAIRESFLQAAKFVGRQEELEQLKSVLDAIVKMQETSVPKAWLIGGESGVGKSRLLDELRIRALVRGTLVLRGQAITEGSIPYQIWRDPLRRLVLSTDLEDADAAVLKNLIPDIESLLERSLSDAPALDPQLSHNRFIRVVLDIFQSLQQPIVVILEDLQWANDENIELLQRLIPLTVDRPLMLIASYRDDERPDLRETLSKMQYLKLKRLDRLSMSELSESMLGDAGRLPEIIALLQHETEGNVFFVVEVVRALAEHVGQLDRINESVLPANLLPVGIQNIVQSRLNRVPENARLLLRLAALAGRELDLDLLRTFTPDLDRWLEECSISAVIEVEQDHWRFAHDKLRESILATILPEDLPNLHRQLAMTLEQVHPNSTAYIPAIARHYQQAQIYDKAMLYLKQAGNLAKTGFANREAIAFYQGALDALKHLLTENNESWQEMSITLFENLGDVLELTGQHEEARQALTTALAHVSQDDFVRLASLQRKIGQTWKNTRAFQEAIQTFIDSVALLDSHRMDTNQDWWHEWIETQIERITIHYWLNQPQEMENVGGSVKPFLEAHATIAQRRLFASYMGLMELRRGRFTITESALSKMNENIMLSKEWGYNLEDVFSRFALGFLYLWHGDLAGS